MWLKTGKGEDGTSQSLGSKSSLKRWDAKVNVSHVERDFYLGARDFQL